MTVLPLSPLWLLWTGLQKNCAVSFVEHDAVQVATPSRQQKFKSRANWKNEFQKVLRHSHRDRLVFPADDVTDSNKGLSARDQRYKPSKNSSLMKKISSRTFLQLWRQILSKHFFTKKTFFSFPSRIRPISSLLAQIWVVRSNPTRV
jgi:hypothetical protein